MSIAVSAVLKPSRLLRGALAAYAVVNLAVAACLVLAAPGAFRAPVAIAACCLLAAAGAVWGFAFAGNVRRIDIFGVGEMRLTVQQNQVETRFPSTPVELMPGSVVWPSLMVLLTRTEGGRSAVVAVFTDSVSPGEFHALAVAIRAFGVQPAPARFFLSGYQKIF